MNRLPLQNVLMVVGISASLLMNHSVCGQALPAITKSNPSEAGASDLARELTNPVADLITLPIQANFDVNLGPLDDGFKLQVNIQPVIPFDLNDDWNLIFRTIVPVIYQENVFPGAGSQFGLGDINQSLFFSPKKSGPGGLIWGAGIRARPREDENLDPAQGGESREQMNELLTYAH